MTLNGGDIIADILKSHRVPAVFTLCGGHISPILTGAKRAGIRVVDVRHEADAVFAADAFARLTGIPGVAVVTAGPGVTNTVTAMKNAQMAQVPLVLLGGAAATMIRGRGALQDIDQTSLFLSIVKQAVTINRNCDIVPVLEDAFQAALSDTPGPVFVECPIDLLYDEALVRRWYGRETAKGSGLKSKLVRMAAEHHVNRMFSCEFNEMAPAPGMVSFPRSPESQIIKAAAGIDGAQRPVMVIGSQALLQPEKGFRLREAVETLGIPVYLTGMARGLMGRTHPLQMRHARSEALKEADLVILAGMPCDFRLGYGRRINPESTLISINRNKRDLTLNRKPDLAIHADPLNTLLSLADRYKGRDTARDPQAWLARLTGNDRNREEEIRAQAAIQGDHVNPLGFFVVLDAFLDDRSMIVADGGDFVATASYILHPRTPLSWLDPGAFGTLGVGGGFALGAALARPESEVWLIYGDGAAGYSLQEMDTFVRHGIPVIAVIGNDASWAQIARDQVEILGDDVATTLRRTAYHEVARGYGAEGFVIKTPGDIPGILERARQTAGQGRPVLINVWIDKSEFRKGSISM